MFRNALIAAAFIGGCADEPVEQRDVDDVPSLLQTYAKRPEPGTMVAFPPVPLFKSPEGLDADHLLLNPGFEQGQRFWTVRELDSDAVTITDTMSSSGQRCLQVIAPPNSEVFISQTVKVDSKAAYSLKPRTFYSFSAFAFAPGETEITAEVQDPNKNIRQRSEVVTGPMSAWSPVSMVFISGAQTESIVVGVYCSAIAENAPVLIDQCALYPLPVENLLPSGSMETLSEIDRAPEWYAGGESISPVSKGYQSEYAAELPLFIGRDSSLVCLVPLRQDLQGRTVLISAMIKSVSDGKAPPPDITVALRLTDADGKRSKTSAICSGTGEWEEVTLAVTVPYHGADKPAAARPLSVIYFKRPQGVGGRVLVDEVVMFAIPHDHFDL